MYIIRNFSSEGLSSYECFLVILTKLDQIYFDTLKVMNTDSIYVIYLSIEMMKWKIDITQH